MKDRTARRIRKLKRSINFNAKKMKRFKNKHEGKLGDFLSLMKTELKVLETKNYEEHLVESEEEKDDVENTNPMPPNSETKFEPKLEQTSRENDTRSHNGGTMRTSNTVDHFGKSPIESLREIAKLNPLCNTSPSFDRRIWDGVIYWCNLLFLDDSNP